MKKLFIISLSVIFALLTACAPVEEADSPVVQSKGQVNGGVKPGCDTVDTIIPLPKTEIEEEEAQEPNVEFGPV